MESLVAKWRDRFIVIAYDLAAVVVAWCGAWWLRHDLHFSPQLQVEVWRGLWPVITIQTSAFLIFGLYRGVWRFASLPDLIRIVKAVACSALCLILLTFNAPFTLPISVLLIFSMMLVSILAGGRMTWRSIKSYYASNKETRQRVLIVGAGSAGEGLLRNILYNSDRRYIPVGFVDDAVHMAGQEIHRVRVLGKIKNIEKIVERHNVDLIFIALPSATTLEMRSIVEVCEKTSVPFRTLPGIKNFADGKISLNSLRKVSIDDLLGRDQVQISWQELTQHFNFETFLITGGGGSIGSELCRQVINLNPMRLVIIDSCEYNLYAIEMELKNKFPQINVIARLVDITDSIAINAIFQQFLPSIVFHAAAYKHVPMLESQVRSAVYNNLIGTQTVAQAAINQNVKTFVLISTDKAVNPTNVMGATKRAAEIFCQNSNFNFDTNFITVRFGNVLGSAGSVVPLFQKQLEAGGPLTVTHPDITRYFMTIPEAAQLILQAAAIGKGGEIFVLNMGEPTKITYLAEQMIKLSGKILNKDIQITFTGLRPGEKLYEELFHEQEQLTATAHPKIMQANARKISWDILCTMMHEISHAAQENNEIQLRNLLHSLVPEYHREVSVPA